MYDGGKIITGLVIFIILVAFPFVYALAGGTGEVPDPQSPSGECVKDKAYMTAWHMDLLNEWRDEVVRDGQRPKVQAGGKEYPRSLTLGCMQCHDDKEQFCDDCHDYAGVSPYCWDCHVEPQGN